MRLATVTSACRTALPDQRRHALRGSRILLYTRELLAICLLSTSPFPYRQAVRGIGACEAIEEAQAKIRALRIKVYFSV